MEHKQKLNDLHCEEHKLAFSCLCLANSCSQRWLCRICKMNHSESHLRTILPLAEMYSDSLLDYIENTLTQKEEILKEKIEEKLELSQKVKNMFKNLENEILKVLNNTKIEILMTIEQLHLQLKVHYNEVYFQELKEQLKKLGRNLRNRETFDSSGDLENFSHLFTKTISSIDYGIHVASRFENESLNLQDILETIKSSCNNLLSRTFVEASKEEIKNFFGQEKVKVAPQTILCMEHCYNVGLFATGGVDGLLTFWDQDTFSYVSHIQTHEDAILTMVYLPAVNTLVTCSKDTTLGILVLKDSKTTPTPFNLKYGKPITQVLALPGNNRLATIYEKAEKVRIWELEEQKITLIDPIDVPPILFSSKMILIPDDELLGITYGDHLQLYSYKDRVRKHYLEAFSRIVSICFMEETKTIHAIIAPSQGEGYNEVIWAKDKNEYKIINKEKIEKTDLYGEPIEIIANSGVVFIVFNQGFAIKKAKKIGSDIKFVEVITQGCDQKNLKPAFLTKNASKIMIAGEMKKLKVYNFS